ncbi:MAG TPA: c-type cytochrome [Stellaceae bacterium]|nr:c-type cytochrome [Stellaceae bacterium]
MTAAVCRMARVAAAVTALAALAACTGNGTSPARSGAAAQEAQATPAQVAGTVHVCSSCHGFDGRSISPTFPRLAGQRAEYIEAQLKAFRDHTRADPHAHTYMWGMAAHLTDPLIKGIAAYYAAQTPASGTKAGSPVDIAAGKKIFEDGIPSHDVPACQACHGAHAEGMAAFPRLAGQHRQYLVEQLQNFASNARRNEIMHENSKNLTPEEISEVTDFLAAQ